MTSGEAVQVGILGPIEVIDDDGQVPLSPQLRRLLGLLVVADGAAVSVDRLAEYVADGKTDGSTVRMAVSRLRKALGGRIESTDGGYRLVLDGAELDAARFTHLREQARSAPSDTVASSLSIALELWRGPAFGELADEEWAAAMASRLDNVRAAVNEDLAAALVTAGRHGEAIERLEAHVVDHPYRERPVELLMRALAGAGRTADAVRTYQAFRVTLRDDTGLEPSSELRELEHELLGALDPVRESVPVGTPLPDGTVTFVFTDIEGSTERWQTDEAAMSEALAAHDRVIREAVEAHAGIVFKHTGDGVCAVFTSAPAAIEAAIDAQRRVQLPVRIGAHTGEAERRGNDYFGPAVNRAARVMDAGHAGQILMSAATAALVGSIERTDLGEHHLRGLASPERIFQIGYDEFPPLRVARQRKGNIPTDLSAFVGRSDEIAALTEQVAEHRLVTLFGVGGTGKTRLSIETALVLAPAFPDGCWLAELASVAVGDAVPFAIATGLGIAVPPGGNVVDHLIARIRHQRLLLIVDNCEHVLAATADAVERLTDECPTLTIVATSREPLMVQGEHLVAVPSLSAEDAERLFLDRARSEAPGFTVDDVQSNAIVELCERLDRLPLAIELAASRLRSLTPVEILGHLDERFRLLVGGRRSRMERHQTMRGTVDWSYTLCDDAEQAVFDRLSVFPANIDADAARAVAGDHRIDDLDVSDALSRLVDRSLLQRSTVLDGTSRYRMLETMRAYGREHLREQGIADEVRGRHARHIAAVIGQLTLRAMGPDEDRVHQRMRDLLPDALAALDWCIDDHDWALALRVTYAGWMAAEREWYALTRRLNDAILAHDGGSAAVDPDLWFEITFVDMTDRGESTDGLDEMYHFFKRGALDRIRRGWQAPTDHFVYPPHGVLGLDVTLTRDEAEECVESLHATRGWPTISRYAAMIGTFHALSDSRHDDLSVVVQAELERVVADLDSAAARRRFANALGLHEEIRGNRAAALRWYESSLADFSGRPTNQEVAAGFRVLRNRAFLALDVTGMQLRRPWQWLRDESVIIQRENGIMSSVPALDRLGRSDLADRLLGWCRARYPGPTAPLFFAPHLTTSGLLDRFLGADRCDEPLDDLIDELLTIADHLDRAASP